MTESVYDGAQTAADILYGYRSYLRAEMVNLTNEEIENLIKKPYPLLKVIYRSKSSVVLMLDSLEDQLKGFDEESLTALQYELDMFREDFDDFLTPEQVEWFNRMYDIVASELDARWLLKKLEERRIVKIERSN